jgi:site-specific DNA recombinase
VRTASSTSSGKRKAVKKLIKTVWRREDGMQISPKSEKMAELVPMKLKKKGGKCTVMEPEAASKTNSALLTTVLKAHLWKRQLEEGKHAEVRELSTTVNISIRYTANYKDKLFSPQFVEDIVNGKEQLTSGYLI